MSILEAAPGLYRVRCLDQPDADGWLLASGRYRLGRAPGSDLRLAHPTVSRLHAEIEVLESGGVMLTDLDSTNGTWLGAQRVTRVALGGDFDLRIGALQLEFCVVAATLTELRGKYCHPVPILRGSPTCRGSCAVCPSRLLDQQTRTTAARGDSGSSAADVRYCWTSRRL